MNATVRPASTHDLDAIMALERASFPTDAWSAAVMRDELASPHGRYLVAAAEAGVVGYAGLRHVAGSADADIQTIAVTAASRGHGIGRMLLRALLDEARRRGAREVFLEVRADNPVAHGLYVSEGFADIGRRAHYYQPDDVDAIVMKAALRGRAVPAAFITPQESAPDGAGGSESADPARICGVMNDGSPEGGRA